MNGITISQVKEKIEWFSNKYSVKFIESGIYSLFPQEGEYGWPAPWHNGSSPGVYILLNSNKEVIYIGEAVTIGKRLGDYFCYDENNNCMIREVSKKDSKFVVSFALEEEEHYMRFSLEQYLIGELNPPLNKYGRTH
ncbi:hypothetical protein CIK99_09720 [Prevotella sp. P5-92]|uniref:GIY-YIG nuclease family protein n=1 Tax=Prevotella sp. P5-92 TaxID=2024222 RepID=UPI000B968A62|nr:GIY-YIG nuclease family protein [Prevotella sp. P5-92]OYP56262.1 hypothetical protein CIK99_09720 [Prevotella sp. P5-92]